MQLSYYYIFLGTVLLDLEKSDLPHIARAVVDNMVLTDQLKEEDSNKVVTALLLQHRHQHQQNGISRRLSSKKKRKIGLGTDNILYNHSTEVFKNEIQNGSLSQNGIPAKVSQYTLFAFKNYIKRKEAIVWNTTTLKGYFFEKAKHL